MLLRFIVLGLIKNTCGVEQRYRLGSLKSVSHYRLDGHKIKTVKGTTLLSCGQSCLAEPRCVSTNFGVSENKLVCELNDTGVSLLSNSKLKYAEGFIFSLYPSVILIGTAMKVRFCFTKVNRLPKFGYNLSTENRCSVRSQFSSEVRGRKLYIYLL